MGLKMLAAFFTVVYLIIVLQYLPLAFVHNDGTLPLFLLGYLVVSLPALWLACFLVGRIKSTFIQYSLLSALGLTLAAVGLFPLAQDYFLSAREKEVAAGVVASQVQDEVLHSNRGNPIGIRLRFSIRATEDGKYSPLVVMYPDGRTYGDLPLNMWQMDSTWETARPPLGPGYTFKSNVTYTLTANLIPRFLLQNDPKTKFCIRSVQPGWEKHGEEFKSFLENPGTTMQYRVRIVVDTFDQYRGRGNLHTVFDEATRSSYNPTEFYESALKEGARECDSPLGRRF